MKTKYIKHFQSQLDKGVPLTEKSRRNMNEHRERNNKELIPENKVGKLRLFVGIYEKNENDPVVHDLTMAIHPIWEDEVDSFLEKHGTRFIKNLNTTTLIPVFSNEKTEAYIEYLEECIDQEEHERMEEGFRSEQY